ncbi:class I SAM-dependent methyltransferase [Kribbella sindirgiensis]|uniref:class I SAM-dependent methyltransferase n=1 Tax=Kribbella sindirgiensis TaxID=1124744 RepID=UPI0013F3DB8F|nr:class I SAM-dependent methyltransferase [Kribbella sindirgiensis]
MSSTAYSTIWDSYWRDLPAGQGEALWDGDPASSVPYELVSGHLHPELPLIDVGCGNGTHAGALADRFPTILGVDISVAALDRARTGVDDRVQFRRLDVLDPADAASIHLLTGDSNVYARGLLHLFTPNERATAVASFAVLNGAAGRLFSYEPAPAAGRLLAELLAQPDGPPPKVARILRYGIQPADLGEHETEDLLLDAGYRIVASGSHLWRSTETSAEGAAVDIPMRYVVARRTE